MIGKIDQNIKYCTSVLKISIANVDPEVIILSLTLTTTFQCTNNGCKVTVMSTDSRSRSGWCF